MTPGAWFLRSYQQKSLHKMGIRGTMSFIRVPLPRIMIPPSTLKTYKYSHVYTYDDAVLGGGGYYHGHVIQFEEFRFRRRMLDAK